MVKDDKRLDFHNKDEGAQSLRCDDGVAVEGKGREIKLIFF